MNFKLKIKPTPTTRKATRHLSSWHEAEVAKQRKAKETQLEEATRYCVENKCKGFKAIASGLFTLIKDARTINRRLGISYEGEKKLNTGDEKEHQKVLTKKEEHSLVQYLLNRNRCRQALSEKEVEGVVLNVLQTRRTVNKKGGRKFIKLSGNAQRCLETRKVGRSFFRRLGADNPILKKKFKNKVSINRGLRCTRSMAIGHLDELASLLIETGIAPDLKQIEPGVWRGKIETERIWAHDETPQFVNYKKSGLSRGKVFAGAGEDCDELTKENRECVTIQPFSNFKGDQAMCQVIFSAAGHSSHMCPKVAEEKIPNLLISVNESGYSDHTTLNAAYKELDQVVQEKGISKPNVIIADGHKSRFGMDVMDTCENTNMEQYLLPPDTTGMTQLHDQVNNRLHKRYEEKKNEIFSEMSDINREGFMTILGEIWEEWVTPEQLVNAGKRVGISEDGLDINWMDQAKFAASEAILNPPQVTPRKLDLAAVIESPEGVRKGSVEYYRRKLNSSMEVIGELSQTTPELEEVPGLLPFKRIVPKSKNTNITKMHGTLKATEVRALMQEKVQKEEEVLKRKQEKTLKKENSKEMFHRCKSVCVCKKNVCVAIKLKECPVCFNVLESQCSKKKCRNTNGDLPKMISVAAKNDKVVRRKIQKYIDESDESEESLDESATDESDNEYDEYASVQLPGKKSGTGKVTGGKRRKNHTDDTDDDTDTDDDIDIQVARDGEQSRTTICKKPAKRTFKDLVRAAEHTEPMKYEEVQPNMWVIVKYDGEDFIGKVSKKAKDVEDENLDWYSVRCLEKPYGMNGPQEWERGDPIVYHTVYRTDKVPTQTQIHSKFFWVYDM